jgi:site-specific DNA recombinase
MDDRSLIETHVARVEVHPERLIIRIAQGERAASDPAGPENTLEGCTARKVNMTISLAFLAPDLVKAAIDGTLPHGMGVVRLADLPAEWSKQHQMLGVPFS